MQGFADPPPELPAIYHRALVCQTFPAYRLEDVRELSVEVLWAMQLLDEAAKAREEMRPHA